MRVFFILLFFIGFNFVSLGQTTSCSSWQASYKQAFTEEEHSPLSSADTANIQFYNCNKELSITARVRLIPAPPTIMFATSSQKVKSFEEYAHLFFELEGKSYQLTAYQSNGDTSALFIPFTDKTNTEETYGGGRYIDIKRSAIHNGTVLLDFNTAYNPYCAYAAGYSCPKPPLENNLPIAIEAGEKNYLGNYKADHKP